MAGVEVLAGLGLMATQLFKYNRTNYEFDQDQRFEREECRLKMQIERFALFREDIRDLVELTVGKMDLYHLIGALFLKMIVLYYCVGFFEREPPPFILCLYYMSNASSWVFLMLAIWLAMHASISSHSYGTRLLTRFVRLPIPGSAQMNVLNARYADFEKQGMQMWRVPFAGKQANTWQQRHAQGHLAKDLADDAEKQKQLAAPPKAKQKKGAGAAGAAPLSARGAAGASEDLLGEGEYAYGGFNDIAGREAEMLRAVEFRTHRHVELFRELQSQWQCYDAYARVAMSLGVREMIQSLCYYLMGLCLVDQQAVYVAYVLVICLQGLALSIYVLDIHGMPCYGNLDLSLAGAAPTILALVQLTIAPRDSEGHLKHDNRYRVALACFLLEICWMHLSLWAASPTDRENAMPRHFRSVLFMDVFAEVDDPLNQSKKGKGSKLNRKQLSVMDRRVEGAEAALFEAHAALRRWEAAPQDCHTGEQAETLKKASKEVERWISALSRELQLRKMPAIDNDLKHRRSFAEMTTADREEDPFIGTVVGPFPQSAGAGLNSKYYYDPEANEYLYEPLPPGRRPLTLAEVVSLVQFFLDEVEGVCAAGGGQMARQHSKSTVGDTDESDEENTPLTRARSASSLPSTVHSPRERQEVGKLRPNRMPWQLVYYSTRGIQIVWFFVFIMSLLNITGNFKVDCTVNPRKYYRELTKHGHGEHGEHGEEGRELAGEFAGELVGGHDMGGSNSSSAEPTSGEHDGGEGEHAVGEHTSGEPEHIGGERTSGEPEHAGGEHTSGEPEHAGAEHTSGEHEHAGGEGISGEHKSAGEVGSSKWVNMCDVSALLGSARRLGAKDWSPRRHLSSVTWPTGSWFRAERLSCLPGRGSLEGHADLLIGTPFATYKLVPNVSGGKGLELEELPSEAFAPSATPLCTSDAASPSASPSCLLGAAVPGGGLDLWPLGASRHEKRTWRVDGEPWRLLTGAVVPCSAATTGISTAPVEAPRCLLLAGMPTTGTIQVAWKPLPAWPITDAAAATAGGRLVAQFEVPAVPDRDVLHVADSRDKHRAPAASSSAGPAALHVDPKSGRLWVLTAEGELIAWALLEGGSPRVEGRWSVRAPDEVQAAGAFRASALCQDQASDDLLVAGRIVGPGAGGPVVLRGQVPRP